MIIDYLLAVVHIRGYSLSLQNIIAAHSKICLFLEEAPGK